MAGYRDQGNRMNSDHDEIRHQREKYKRHDRAQKGVEEIIFIPFIVPRAVLKWLLAHIRIFSGKST